MNSRHSIFETVRIARKYISLLCISKLNFIFAQFCGGYRDKVALDLHLINDIHNSDIMKVEKNKSPNNRSPDSLPT